MESAEKLERHYHLLTLVAKNHPIGIVRLSNHTGMAKHKVRYSLRTLEQDGLIEPTPDGAIITDAGRETLEHFEEDIDELIAILNSVKTRQPLVQES